MVHNKRKVLGFGLAAAGFFIIALLIAGVAMGGDGGMADDRIAILSGIESESEIESGSGSGGALAASSVSSSINYQGRLTDSASNPLDGTYTMTFKLYENASGGSALATDTHPVSVTEGLFSTNIAFGSWWYFDGRALWLGIQVGTDPEMTPRQELRPVPYALSLRPGAWIVGNTSDPALLIGNTVVNEGGGVYAFTTGSHSIGVHASTEGFNSEGVYASTSGNYSEGIYAYTNGYNSPAVYGSSSKDVGVYGKGKEAGGYFTTTAAGTYEQQKPGLNVSTQYDYNPGVLINTSGYDSEGVFASTSGYYSEGVRAHTEGGYSEGVYVSTSGYYSKGVFASTIGNASEGVYVSTSGNYSRGVRAHTEGDSSEGVFAWTTGDNSPAVYGYSSKDVGVYGKGKEAGGYFMTTTAGTYEQQKPGVNVSTQYNYNPGVLINTSGYNSEGVFAETYGSGSRGILAATEGDFSEGIYAETYGYYSDGVRARTLGDHSNGIYAETHGDNSPAVYGSSSKDVGVYGKGKEAGGYFTTKTAGTSTNRKSGVNVSTQYGYNPGVLINTDGNWSDGVSAYTYGAYSTAVFGRSDKWWGGIFSGAGDQGIYVYGDIEKTGSVSFVEDHPTDPNKEIVYVCLEGGETGTYTRGSALLIDGEAVVQLPEHFSMVTSAEGLTVQVTPTSECKGLYIVSKSPTEFVVKELSGGTSDATFDYHVNGVRKGYEDFQPIRDKQEMPESGELARAPEHLEAEEHRHSSEPPADEAVLSETE
jgi:hypothetical protein